MNWVAWEKTIAPIEYGGLGFGSLKDANLAMLAKWWWRFKIEKDGLWRNLIWAIHHNNRSWTAIPAKVSMSGPWKQIMSIHDPLARRGIDLKKTMKTVMVNGSDTSFWLDGWMGEIPLNLRYPRLFSLERSKMCNVADRINPNVSGPRILWDWVRPISNDQENHELQDISALLSAISVSSGLDRLFLSSFNRSRPNRVFMWNNWTPKKVGIVAWRAEKIRLPTKEALARRRINIPNLSCILCGEYVESSDHLFVACHFAQTIWQNIASWCKIPPIVAFDIRALLDLHGFIQGSRKRKKALHAIVLIVIWCIWKTRNEAMFNNAQPHIVKVLEEVKSLGFFG
ncbi:putative reverse transcriptase zinc-binding domain-containing protein [Helianthus anomalus]